MANYIAEPIKFTEFKQSDPTSFIFNDHYFKLVTINTFRWEPNFIIPSIPEEPADSSITYSGAMEYVYTVGTIFTNSVLMQRTKIEDILEDPSDEDKEAFKENLDDADFIHDMTNIVSDKCKPTTDLFIKELKAKGALYDNLLFHFAFYFDMVPINAYVKIIFNDGKIEYQFVIRTIFHNQFNQFQSSIFPEKFYTWMLNDKLFEFHLQKIYKSAKDVEDASFNAVHSARTSIICNPKYGVKGIYATELILTDNIGNFNEIASLVKNRAFVPMPFELRVDENNNVPTSNNKDNIDYEYNRNAIISQYNKYANFIVLENIFGRVRGITTAILENDDTGSYSFGEDYSPVKYAICVDISRVTSPDYCTQLAVRLVPTRLVFKKFTADLRVTSHSINKHEIKITLDDGYAGDSEVPSIVSSNEVYNMIHHMFFSSPLNTHWGNTGDFINHIAKPRMGLNYIACLGSSLIKSPNDTCTFAGIERKRYTDSNGQEVVTFTSMAHTKFFCDSKNDAKRVIERIKKDNITELSSGDVFFPVISTPTIIIYRSFAPVRSGKLTDIHKYDFIGICNIVYNHRNEDNNSVFERVSSTDILNWQAIAYPYIDGKHLAIIPITNDLFLLVDSSILEP